jgi:quercetin dioxygenase-like cupin family protein
MRPADTADHPTATTPWSESDLVELTIRLANQPATELAGEFEPGTGPSMKPGTGPSMKPGTGPSRKPSRNPGTEPSTEPSRKPSTQPTPAAAGPLAGRVTHPGGGVLRPSTAPADRGGAVFGPSTAPADREGGVLRTPAGAAWSVPLLVTPDVEAWLLGWPAGLVTPAHDHGGVTVAVTVVEGSLSEECLDPTIWTTGRRTTWRAGASTLFPSGHVHLLGAAGDRPAVAVHAWSGAAGSADRFAGRLALARGGAVAGRGPGGGRGAGPVGVGSGRGGDGRRAGHPVHGAADLVHARDRVAG